MSDSNSLFSLSHPPHLTSFAQVRTDCSYPWRKKASEILCKGGKKTNPLPKRGSRAMKWNLGEAGKVRYRHRESCSYRERQPAQIYFTQFSDDGADLPD